MKTNPTLRQIKTLSNIMTQECEGNEKREQKKIKALHATTVPHLIRCYLFEGPLCRFAPT
jgi:hypothetical protein